MFHKVANLPQAPEYLYVHKIKQRQSIKRTSTIDINEKRKKASKVLVVKIKKKLIGKRDYHRKVYVLFQRQPREKPTKNFIFQTPLLIRNLFVFRSSLISLMISVNGFCSP